MSSALGAGLQKSRAKSTQTLPLQSAAAQLKNDKNKDEQILSLNSEHTSDVLAPKLPGKIRGNRQLFATTDFSKEKDSIIRKFFDGRRKMRTCTRIEG